MQSLERFTEFSLINKLTKDFKQHPDQVNKRHQSDSEILLQPDGSFLAVTIDTLQEEYSLGLIRDPFTVGWSVVSHSLSDLAAVGAKPIGVLLAVNLSQTSDSKWAEDFFGGVQASLDAHSTYCLGGDTNFSDSPSFTCTALGRVDHPKPLSRIGAESGDPIYVTGLLGMGNLLGIASHADKKLWEKLEKEYRPYAKIREVCSLFQWLKCAIDTSDALIQALAILGSLNNIGAHFYNSRDFYDPRLINITDNLRFPLWLVNVFGMGEYEIVFTVEPWEEEGFLRDASEKGIFVKKIGEMRSKPGISAAIDGNTFELDVPYLLNLFGTCGSVEKYLEALIKYDNHLRASL
ncbi:hypothetical protein HYY75_06120 [bacterium]|nr:hypothetical protein [bacterium]